jgi:hypothetical protein
VLLSSTLRPHGKGARPRPIFPGSNDKAYKVLAEWANHLVAPNEGDGAPHREPSRDSAESDEVFAVDRNRSTAVLPTKDAAALTRMPASARYATAPGGPVIRQDPSDPQEFPIPFAVSGVKPKLPPLKDSAKASAKRPSAADALKAPGARASTKPPPLPDDDDDDAPAPPKRKSGTDAGKTPAKPISIDPKLLEKALQNRNANRPPPGSN